MVQEIVGSTKFGIFREIIEVTPLTEPDLSWVHVDKRGHKHQYTNEGEVLSIRYVEDTPATEEYPAEYHYECKRCREVICPKVAAPTSRSYIEGLSNYYINDVRVTKEEFEQMLKRKRWE